MAIGIRSAARADALALAALMAEFHAESGYALDRSRAAAGFARLIESPALGAVWIAHDGETPAGYVALTMVFSMDHAGLCGVVDDLYVRPAYRRRGAGRGLMRALLDACAQRGANAAWLEVGVDNAAGRALYAHCGFAPRGGAARIAMVAPIGVRADG